MKSAAEFYRKAVALHPEIPELQANLGLMYYQTGKDQQAIDAFSQAIRLKPGLFVPNLFLGLDYVKLKRFNEAIPYLKRAALLPTATDVQARLALGHAYTGDGKTRLAIAVIFARGPTGSEKRRRLVSPWSELSGTGRSRRPYSSGAAQGLRIFRDACRLTPSPSRGRSFKQQRRTRRR